MKTLLGYLLIFYGVKINSFELFLMSLGG